MLKDYSYIDKNNIEMHITLSNDELSQVYEQAYLKARKDIDMKGFRKGKVPLNMIKKFYGPVIEQQAETEHVNELFNEIVNTDDLQIMAQPELKDAKDVEDGKMFTIAFASVPQIELGDYKGITIDEPVHTVNDEEIENYMFKFSEEHADFEPADEINDKFFVIGISVQPINDETNQPEENLAPQEMHVYLNDKKFAADLVESFMYKKIGEVFVYQPIAMSEQPTKPLQITINDIQKMIPKEMTDDFVKHLTNDKFENVEEYKEEIGYKLQEAWDKKSRESMENQLIEKLIELHPDIEVPERKIEEFTNAYLHNFKHGKDKNTIKMIDKNIAHYKAELRPGAEHFAKWDIIKSAIIRKEELKVESHDIDMLIETEIQHNKQLAELPREEIENLILNNNDITKQILNKKVLDMLLDFAITNQVDFEGSPLEDDDFDTLTIPHSHEHPMNQGFDFEEEIDDDEDDFDDDEIEFDEEDFDIEFDDDDFDDDEDEDFEDDDDDFDDFDDEDDDDEEDK